VEVDLQDYEKKIVSGQEGSAKEDLIFILPLFCIICQRIVGESVRDVLAEEVKNDKEKKRNWHQLLERAHEDTW